MSQSSSPPASTKSSPVVRSPITIADLLSDLLWPKLLRSASLALSSSRIGLAYFAIVVVFMLDTVGSKIFGSPTGPIAQLSSDIGRSVLALYAAAASGNAHAFSLSTYDLLVARPFSLISNGWKPALLAFLVILPGISLFAVIGGAISRSAACEASQRVKLTWTQSLAFALARWRSLVGCILGPLVIIWFVAGLLWIIAQGFKVPYLDVITSLVFSFSFIAALVAAVISVAFVFGQSMLIPAVAAEGGDAFDSVQRAYAYTLARPGRLVVYSVILAIQGLIAIGVVGGIVYLVFLFTATASRLPVDHFPSVSAMANPLSVNPFSSAPIPNLNPELAEQSGTLKLAVNIVNFFAAILAAGIAAYAVSFYFTASTMLYLVMRQLVDGQDVHELWMPGMVDATLARADAPSPLRPGGGTPTIANQS
ncbi:MAG: hypothetical protein IBJ18_10085 [Phycisphaerales bacterium]|nr:hypothetical protein [Phycisphaerales bacterium]